MSYILDALRRAQADRERGQIPSLHAQQAEFHADPVVPVADTSARSLPPVVLALVFLALLLLGVALWVAIAPGAAVPDRAAATLHDARAVPAPSTVPAASADAVAPANAVTAAASAAPVVSPPVPPWPQVVTAPPTVPRPQPSAPPPAAALPAPTVTAPATTAPAATQAAAAAAPALSPTIQPGTVAVPSLSAEMRRSWPPLVVGGSVWSAHAPSRFVILNGEVLHEGGRTTGGVLVERIEPKSVVLRWQTQAASLPL